MLLLKDSGSDKDSGRSRKSSSAEESETDDIEILDGSDNAEESSGEDKDRNEDPFPAEPDDDKDDSKEDVTPIEPDEVFKSDNDKAHEAFAPVVREKEAEYGEMWLNSYDNGNGTTAIGLMYLEIIDMDGDGVDEMILATTPDPNDETKGYDRYIELWAYIDGKAECVSKTDLMVMCYGVDSAMITIYKDEDDGSYGFLANVDEGELSEDELYSYAKMIGFKDGEVTKKYVYTTDFFSDSSSGRFAASGYTFTMTDEQYVYSYCCGDEFVQEWTSSLMERIRKNKEILGL